MKTNRMSRFAHESVIGGVAAGMAHHFGIDRVLMRVLFVLAFFFTKAVPMVVLYIILWAVLPKAEPNTGNVEIRQV
ncbi:MAG: PspC domain-containing protein [Runella sp.]